MEKQTKSNRQLAFEKWKKKYLPRRVEQEEREKLREHLRVAGRALADKTWREIFQNKAVVSQ